MRVVHLSTAHPAKDTRILRRECATLAADGRFDITYLNAKGEEFSYKNVSVVSFDRPRKRVGRFLLSVPKALHAVCRRPCDVVHLHDPELMLLVPLIRLTGRRVIFDFHENYMEKIYSRRWIPGVLRPSARILFGALVGTSTRCLSGVVAATPEISRVLGHRNSVVIRNLPDVHMIKPPPTGADRVKGLLLYTGGLTANRGIVQVIDALRGWEFEDWRLVIVGRENPIIADLVADALRDERIEYRGEVDFGEVLKLMQRAAVGVVCNQPGYDYEMALPNKLFEYMAAGLPVVASNFPVWTDIILGSGAGLVCDPTSRTDIQRAIGQLLSDSAGRSASGMLGRELVQREFSWSEESKKLIELYKGLFTSRGEVSR